MAAFSIQDAKQLSHAYILASADRQACLDLALRIAAAAVCLRGTDVPCGECRACRKALADIHPDVIHIRREADKSVVTVDQIRAMNIDAFVCGDELYVIEAGGRCGATCIPELISMYGGIDYYGLMIKAACGLPTDFSLRTAVPCMASLLYVTEECRVVSYDSDKISALRDRGIFVSFDYAEGALLPAMHNGTDRIGQVYAPCSSASEFEKIRAEALSACHME